MPEYSHEVPEWYTYARATSRPHGANSADKHQCLFWWPGGQALALRFILISSAQENVLQLLCRGCTRIPATCSGWRSVTGSTLYRPMAVCSTISGESTHQLHTKISVDNLEIVLKLISPNFSAFASDWKGSQNHVYSIFEWCKIVGGQVIAGNAQASVSDRLQVTTREAD